MTNLTQVIATMLLTLNVDKKPMIPMVATAIDEMFNHPKSMFWTGRVMDVLFDGILIDCSNEESFQVKAVCGVFASGEVNAIKPFNDTHFSFSLFQAVRLRLLSFNNHICLKKADKIVCKKLEFSRKI